VKKYFIPIIFVALISAVSIPIIQVHAGGVDPIPEPPFDKNAYHAEWFEQNLGTQMEDPFDAAQFNAQFPFNTNVNPTGGCSDQDCSFTLPNYIDNLNTKLIRISVTYDQNLGGAPTAPSVTCHDSPGVSQGMYVETIPALATITWEFECDPNPDWEVIQFIRDTNNIFHVTIWTASFDRNAVGGEMMPIDTTALLVAGTTFTASWMVPIVVSAAGIGLLIQSQKTRLKHNFCPSCHLETDDIFKLGGKKVGKCQNPKCRVSLFFAE